MPSKKSTASTTPTRRTCGTMQVHEQLLRSDADYVGARAASETRAWEYGNRMRASSRTGITVIPVVVHVVYKTAAENISDAQVQSQITVLNADYRKANTDLADLPAAFAPLAADARVEFELATTDPDGNPTTGIVRVQTTSASFVDDNKVKHAATGGSDAWPRDDYLNLWACSLGNNLLGYAQFPGGPADTDGVVILNTAFGDTGTAAAPFGLGRTASHEIGHWLNLRHIWGDDGNGCNGDDLVADTPNAAGPNVGTPAFPHVTCNNGPNGDLFMNYMDYTDDAAMFMFTNGQVGRMQAALDGDRASIGHTKPGPTLFFADVHPTLTTQDVHPTIATIDAHPTLFTADLHPTIAIQDVHPTLALADAHPTLAVVDAHPTLAVLDQGPTLAIIDQGIPTIGGEQIPGPGPIEVGPVGPVVQGDPGGAVPFSLATGHHSMAWTGAHPGLAAAEVQALQTQVEQYRQLLGEYAKVDAEGRLGTTEQAAADEAYATYTELVAQLGRLTNAG